MQFRRESGNLTWTGDDKGFYFIQGKTAAFNMKEKPNEHWKEEETSRNKCLSVLWYMHFGHVYFEWCESSQILQVQ